MRRLAAAVALAALATAAPAAPAAGDLADELATRWRGAWALTATETFSGCGAYYTDNRTRGRLVASKGDYRFAAGELAHVDKIDVHRGRIDLLVTLAEPLRIARRDGPFTLYEQASCKVELEVELPRRLIRSGAVGEIDRALGAVLARFESPEEAQADAGWNGRQVEPFPADYGDTLARHAAWKAEQANVAVGARIDQAIEEAARLADRLDDDPEYLAGFAAGVDRARDAYFGDCGSLLSSTVYGFTHSAPDKRNRAWKDGYEEGQRLVYYLELARRLRGCFVPVPPVAER